MGVRRFKGFWEHRKEGLCGGASDRRGCKGDVMGVKASVRSETERV